MFITVRQQRIKQPGQCFFAIQQYATQFNDQWIAHGYVIRPLNQRERFRETETNIETLNRL